MEATYDNILLVCLDGVFCKSISEELADKLDMFFADLQAYIEYDLLDSKAVLQTCGIDYFKEREFKATKNFAKFQNTVLTADYDLFKDNRKAFTTSLIVYLQLPKKFISAEETINILSFENRDKYLAKESSLVLSLKSKNKNKALKDLLKKLEEAL